MTKREGVALRREVMRTVDGIFRNLENEVMAALFPAVAKRDIELAEREARPMDRRRDRRMEVARG